MHSPPSRKRLPLAPSLTRREAFRLAGALALVLGGPKCAPSTSPASTSSSAPLSDQERAELSAIADVILPPDEEPGGAALGAIAYLEGLVTAFDHDVPRIFAGGPFSGRNPLPDASGHASSNFPENDFSTFIELDRVSDASWRLEILGSAGLPGGGPNDALLGATPSLADRVRKGLADARASSDRPLTALGYDDLLGVFNAQSQDWKDLMIDLVTEAAFSAPEYGGNAGLAGWKVCHFEGDSAPLGYSQWDGQKHVERPDAPLSTANPGPDPAPLGPDVDALLALVVGVLGGRSATS